MSFPNYPVTSLTQFLESRVIPCLEEANIWDEFVRRPDMYLGYGNLPAASSIVISTHKIVVSDITDIQSLARNFAHDTKDNYIIHVVWRQYESIAASYESQTVVKEESKPVKKRPHKKVKTEAPVKRESVKPEPESERKVTPDPKLTAEPTTPDSPLTHRTRSDKVYGI